MAPSSLKKMSGSGARKEGNYASSNESTSLDVFKSNDLGLTLLPGPQTQKEDEGEEAQAAVGTHTKSCTTEQQEDDQRRALELDEPWHPIKRRSSVDESIGESCYFGLSKGWKRSSSTGSHDDDAVPRPNDCCSGITGKRNPKRSDSSLWTETLSNDIGGGHHHDRSASPKTFRATHALFLAKEGLKIEHDLLSNLSSQMSKEEGRNNSLNGTNSSLDGVLGTEQDCGRDSDAKACENSLEYKFCGSKGRKSEDLLRTTSSGILGETFTRPTTDNILGTSHRLSWSKDSVERPHHSACPFESQSTYSVVTERKDYSHCASAFLAPEELQGSSKATATAHQQTLDGPQLFPHPFLKPPQVSRNLHAAPPKKVSKPAKQLKRSWTRHFPDGSKDLPSRKLNSDHAHTSSAMLSFSIGSKTHSNSLKTWFARESRCKLLTHPNPRTLATSPPIHIETSSLVETSSLIENFSRASYGLERHTFDNRADTGIVQSRLKAGIKRSKSLPNLRLPYQSSIMAQQPGRPADQFPTPPTERHALGDNAQYPGSNHSFLPPNQDALSVRRDTLSDINTPLPVIPYQDMQPSNSLPDSSLPNQSLTIYQQHGHQAHQYPTLPTEPHALGDNSQYPGSNHIFLPPNQQTLSVLEEAIGHINTLLPGMSHQNIQGDFPQPIQYQGMGTPIYGYPRAQISVHGSNNQTVINQPVATNDNRIDVNGNRLYTTAEYMALGEQCILLSGRNENHSEALDHARTRDRLSQAKIKEQERVIVHLRQQLKPETPKIAKPPKEGVKTKSSGDKGVASTVNWARLAHPVAGQQSTNARSASLDSSPIQLRDRIDGVFLESGANIPIIFSPIQSQHASVPALATGSPSTQATQIQAPHSELFQSGAQYPTDPYQYPPGPYKYPPGPYQYPPGPHQYPPGPYHPPYSPNPIYSPSPPPFGQCPNPGPQAGDPLQNQENQFQQSPAHHSVENYQQSPQLPVSQALPTAAQADASTVGTKRKREAEPNAGQAVKRQQQPVEAQPEVSPDKAAEDDHASSEVRRKMSQKRLDWLEGFHPYEHVSKDRQQPFGVPSASLSQANPLPALTAQAPMRLVVPTPSKGPRKTTQNTPKSAAEKKAARALYNKNYKKSKRESRSNGKLQAAENLGASGTTSSPYNADNDDDGLHGSVGEEIDGNGYLSISDDNDHLSHGYLIPKEATAHGAVEESNNNTNQENPFGLSAEDLDWVTRVENELAMEDDPTYQAVEGATEGPFQRITEVEDEESEAE